MKKPVAVLTAGLSLLPFQMLLAKPASRVHIPTTRTHASASRAHVRTSRAHTLTSRTHASATRTHIPTAHLQAFDFRSVPTRPAFAAPATDAIPANSPFKDEIRKALSLQLFGSDASFQADQVITAKELQTAIARSRQYLADAASTPLPAVSDHPLTRLEVISGIVQGLVADHRITPGLTDASGAPAVDSDVTYAGANLHNDYLADYKDVQDLSSSQQLLIAVAAYKGLLPNMSSSEPHQLRPQAPATEGYAACLLARLVHSPSDYTGVVIDLTGLAPLARRSSMYIVSAGDAANGPTAANLVYPNNSAPPVRAFWTAPGVISYDTNVDLAEQRRVGKNPLIIHALDWALYDFSTRGAQIVGWTRGGGQAVPVNQFGFSAARPDGTKVLNPPTAPLVILSPEDAQKLQELDHTDLLLRTGKVALVHPAW